MAGGGGGAEAAARICGSIQRVSHTEPGGSKCTPSPWRGSTPATRDGHGAPVRADLGRDVDEPWRPGDRLRSGPSCSFIAGNRQSKRGLTIRPPSIIDAGAGGATVTNTSRAPSAVRRAYSGLEPALQRLLPRLGAGREQLVALDEVEPLPGADPEHEVRSEAARARQLSSSLDESASSSRCHAGTAPPRRRPGPRRRRTRRSSPGARRSRALPPDPSPTATLQPSESPTTRTRTGPSGDAAWAARPLCFTAASAPVDARRRCGGGQLTIPSWPTAPPVRKSTPGSAVSAPDPELAAHGSYLAHARRGGRARLHDAAAPPPR